MDNKENVVVYRRTEYTTRNNRKPRCIQCIETKEEVINKKTNIIFTQYESRLRIRCYNCNDTIVAEKLDDVLLNKLIQFIVDFRLNNITGFSIQSLVFMKATSVEIKPTNSMPDIIPRFPIYQNIPAISYSSHNSPMESYSSAENSPDSTENQNQFPLDNLEPTLESQFNEDQIKSMLQKLIDETPEQRQKSYQNILQELENMEEGSVDETDGRDKYKSEAERLASFRGWSNCNITPTELAKAGLYYLGSADRVKCFECGVQICNWEKDDHALNEHARWGGSCAFIKGLPCGNIPINNNQNNKQVHIQEKQRSYDICGFGPVPSHVKEKTLIAKEEKNCKNCNSRSYPCCNATVKTEEHYYEDVEVPRLNQKRQGTDESLNILCYRPKPLGLPVTENPRKTYYVEKELVFRPGSHLAMCRSCSERIDQCPACQYLNTRKIRTTLV